MTAGTRKLWWAALCITATAAPFIAWDALDGNPNRASVAGAVAGLAALVAFPTGRRWVRADDESFLSLGPRVNRTRRADRAEPVGVAIIAAVTVALVAAVLAVPHGPYRVAAAGAGLWVWVAATTLEARWRWAIWQTPNDEGTGP